jgi:protein ImuA
MDLMPAAVPSPAPSRPVAAGSGVANLGRGRTHPQVPAQAAQHPAPQGVQALPAGRPGPAILPETLHPALWLGHQLGRTAAQALPSGFAALDAQLPGGGWPRRVLTELLLPHPGVGEVRLLAPCLAACQRSGRLVMLFDPPAALSAWALVQLGFDVEQLLVIHTRARLIPGSDSLWALEQALKSGHVGAVLAWLPPRLRAERLRRLQLAAHTHDGPAFVLRELAAQQRPSAAPLRLALRAAGADTLALRLLKRRGPPLEAPLQIALPPVLSGVARQRALAGAPQALRAATFVNLA